jgi:hypothetical protein
MPPRPEHYELRGRPSGPSGLRENAKPPWWRRSSRTGTPIHLVEDHSRRVAAASVIDTPLEFLAGLPPNVGSNQLDPSVDRGPPSDESASAAVVA